MHRGIDSAGSMGDMSADDKNKFNIFYMLFVMSEAVIATVGWAAVILHLARHFGASELDAVTYTICSVLVVCAVFMSQIIGTAIDSLHPEIDKVNDSLNRLRASKGHEY